MYSHSIINQSIKEWISIINIYIDVKPPANTYTKNNMVINKKALKASILPLPMHLLLHGQWWSNSSTHTLQSAQCLVYTPSLNIILQVEHDNDGLYNEYLYW